MNDTTRNQNYPTTVKLNNTSKKLGLKLTEMAANNPKKERANSKKTELRSINYKQGWSFYQNGETRKLSVAE